MKIINIILGLGTAIILGALVNLGIAAFHPAPVAPDYNTIVTPAAAYPYPAPCAVGDAACLQKTDAYNAQQQAQQQEFNKENNAYQDSLKVYNRDVFIIANIVGIIVFIAGFLILFATSIVAQSVPIGIMVAGLWSIIYGYMQGWGSTNDQLKFFVGLVVAVLVIGGSIWLVERYQKKRAAA
jgi:hypothetical protein